MTTFCETEAENISWCISVYVSCEFVPTLTISHSEVEALGVMKDNNSFPRATFRRYNIIISVIFLLMGE